VSEWRAIETAPLDTPVLVSEDNNVGEARCHWDEGWYWAGNDPTDSWGGRIYPTFWQPLPAPPSERSRNDKLSEALADMIAMYEAKKRDGVRLGKARAALTANGTWPASQSDAAAELKPG
jgi:hypothetical protein